MSVYGNIITWRILTLEEDLAAHSDTGHAPYVSQKHQVAADNERYIVACEIQDPRYNIPEKVAIYLPKGLVDNGLIDESTYIQCGSGSCHLSIIGVDDWFDRAYNGKTVILDKKLKATDYKASPFK